MRNGGRRETPPAFSLLIRQIRRIVGAVSAKDTCINLAESRRYSLKVNCRSSERQRYLYQFGRVVTIIAESQLGQGTKDKNVDIIEISGNYSNFFNDWIHKTVHQ